MAVTRDGIPVRVWCWPGNTADSALIRQVKDDMRDWCLSQGHLGRRPRLHLRGEPPLPAQGRRQLHHRGEAPLRLRRRAGRPVPAGPLQGRRAGTSGSRKCGSPRTSGSSSASTPRPPSGTPPSAPSMIARLEEADRRTPTSSASDKRAELRGVISTKPGLNRYLRVTPGGLLRIDAGEGEGRGEPRREVPAAGPRTRSCPPRTSPSATSSSWKSSAAGET